MLSRVRLLSWDGEAIIHAGDRDVRIGVSTEVAPFVSARSTSWPLERGRSASRTMVINETGGRMESGGRSEPLPPAMVAHERAQFSIYGLMLLAPLDRGGASIRQDDQPSTRLKLLRVSHLKAPVTRLYFEKDGRLAQASNSVPHHETGRPVRQHFYFSPEQMPGPVRWPRDIRIEQEGRPWFELTLSRFEAVL